MKTTRATFVKTYTWGYNDGTHMGDVRKQHKEHLANDMG
jgi:hypothetical protein